MNVYCVYFQLVVVSLGQFVVDLVFGNNIYALEVALSITDVEFNKPLVLSFTVSIYIESTTFQSCVLNHYYSY